MLLEDLIDKTLSIIKTRGYTEKTWKFAFHNGRFSSFREYFETRGKEDFDIDLANEYIAEIQKRYADEKISYSRAAHLKKLAAWFIEVYETGELQWKKPHTSKTIINDCFKEALIKYLDSRKDVLSFTNLRAQKSDILHMLGFLQDEKGYSNFSPLSRNDVQDFVLYIRRRRQGRLDHIVYSIRYFLLFLKEKGIIATDLTSALYLPAQKARKILAGFTHEEVDLILAQVNRDTPIGKRDYAILLLGRNTGLRIGDIIKLKLMDIDWRYGEVSVTQRKTGRPLVLPLEKDSEFAIIDYIRSGRPRCDLPFLFLRHNAPSAVLSQQVVTTIFTRYGTAAGISHVSGDGKTFHGLRRSLANWMLEADVPLTTISQVLGHHDLSSASLYLSIDEKNLKKCALSIEKIEVDKEGLT